MDNEINSRVRNYRRQRKISQREMAKMLGMSYNAYSQLERNGIIKTQLVLEIAYHLNVEPGKLMLNGLMAEYERLRLKNS